MCEEFPYSRDRILKVIKDRKAACSIAISLRVNIHRFSVNRILRQLWSNGEIYVSNWIRYEGKPGDWRPEYSIQTPEDPQEDVPKPPRKSRLQANRDWYERLKKKKESADLQSIFRSMCDGTNSTDAAG